MEAQDSFWMRGLIKVGLAESYEESGNFVYRFTRQEINKICRSLFLPEAFYFSAWVQYVPFLNKHLFNFNENSWKNNFWKKSIQLLNYFAHQSGNSFNMILLKQELGEEILSSLKDVPNLQHQKFK